ncbi:MAG: hypothetical protein ACRELF_19160, partial [Gemmataceae bacterium]
AYLAVAFRTDQQQDTNTRMSRVIAAPAAAAARQAPTFHKADSDAQWMIFHTRPLAAMIERARKRLSKKAKKGFRGWPLATIALYGPDDSTATKLTVGIVPAEDAEATDLRRWFSKEQSDIRDDIRVTEEVLAFIAEAGVKSVVMTDRIIGCPHEEGIDYEGATCPACRFWAGRDRWTGERPH